MRCVCDGAGPVPSNAGTGKEQVLPGRCLLPLAQRPPLLYPSIARESASCHSGRAGCPSAAQGVPPPGPPSPRSDVHRPTGVCPVSASRPALHGAASSPGKTEAPAGGARGEGGDEGDRLAQQPALVGRPSGHVAWACPRRTTAIALDRRTPGHMLTVLSASCVTLGSHAPPLP